MLANVPERTSYGLARDPAPHNCLWPRTALVLDQEKRDLQVAPPGTQATLRHTHTCPQPEATGRTVSCCKEWHCSDISELMGGCAGGKGFDDRV